MSTTTPQRPDEWVVDVRPGDQDAATEVEGWLQAYASSRDPVLRERIILTYLGLADRLAGRYRHSRGTTREDLTQTARAGLIGAIDRYNPDTNRRFVPFAVACVVGELKPTCATPAGGCTCPAPSKSKPFGCAEQLMSCSRSLGTRRPSASWPRIWRWVRRRCWRRWRP